MNVSQLMSGYSQYTKLNELTDSLGAHGRADANDTTTVAPALVDVDRASGPVILPQ